MKNCPFCESFDTKITGEFRKDFGTRRVYVLCLNCGCQGPSLVKEGQTVDLSDSAEVIKLWDKREYYVTKT